tara:strand:+ start:6668 stop:9994 length:3327 start_codon:yes stop_codon:yes gene_type:complete
MSINRENKTNDERLREIMDIYKNSTFNNDELEVRFGTNYKNVITKITFDNVIEKLKSLGFTCIDNDGAYHLNISPEIIDEKRGNTRVSNYIRVAVNGFENIQNYCKKNNFNLENFIPYYLRFEKKVKKKHEGSLIEPIVYDDFEFKVNYKVELNMSQNDPQLINILSDWVNIKKVFRFIKRFTFTHPNYPFKFDCSIVKTSTKRKYYVPTYNIQDSNVFNNPENYEIELELIQDQVKSIETNLAIQKLKTGIKYILSGLQQTNFPISYKEQTKIKQSYVALSHHGTGTQLKTIKKITNKFFMGPSSISLEMPNIIKKEDVNVANINDPYTVTDKADGLRKLLYISSNGKIYFIDTNLNIQFTGYITKQEDMKDSILDGEHVFHGKNGNVLNTFYCFDIYVNNKKNIQMLPFMKMDKYKDKFKTSRLSELKNFVNKLKPSCVVKSSKNVFNIVVKKFYDNLNPKTTIFDQCKKIMDLEKDGLFDYETDGLIFTPIDKGVGSYKLGERIKPYKRTWKLSLKWKPSYFNTIDFLVKTKKINSTMDFVGNVVEDGIDVSSDTSIKQYKTLILNVGYSEKNHGFINAYEDVLNGEIPKNIEDLENYRPVPFLPSDPSPIFPIYLCNIPLVKNGNIKYMLTEDGKQSFTDNMIVEFRFDKNAKKYEQWVPIRVRYDKTADFQRGFRSFGNDFNTAQSVWRSINNPITEEMITTGLNIPDTTDENVYYNRTTNVSQTKGLRDFHNKFVKKMLITTVSKRNNSLIDMTVGKGGDLFKWISARLSFVLGIDVSKDNIINTRDGACARYLKDKIKYANVPDAIFLNGDSKKNIRNGNAFSSEKEKQIIKSLFGSTNKDSARSLGSQVLKYHGRFNEGFNVVSNQFSIHYFFENPDTLNNFIRNVSECCMTGGYFIGTCYDGKRIFNKLRNLNKGEHLTIENNGVKIWDVTKQYDNEEFNDNETSLGYKIDVYQETINKTFSEFLVNFEYLKRIMENYGFTTLSDEECKNMGIPSSIGSFKELFKIMKDNIGRKYLKPIEIGQATSMSLNEKKISFLNNYFIFKKISNVNTKSAFNIEIKKYEESLTKDDDTVMVSKKKSSNVDAKIVKKYKKKFKMPK